MHVFFVVFIICWCLCVDCLAVGIDFEMYFVLLLQIFSSFFFLLLSEILLDFRRLFLCCKDFLDVDENFGFDGLWGLCFLNCLCLMCVDVVGVHCVLVDGI